MKGDADPSPFAVLAFPESTTRLLQIQMGGVRDMGVKGHTRDTHMHVLSSHV